MPIFTNNHAAAAFWQKVADGNLDDDVKELLPHVATEILHAVFHTEYIVHARRNDAAKEAVGFFGKTEKYPGIHETAKELSGLSAPDQAGVWALVSRFVPEDFDEKVAAKTLSTAKTRPKKKKT